MIEGLDFDATALGPDVPDTLHLVGDEGFCWCQPTVEHVGIDGTLVIHRSTLDSPTREPDDA
jgi:hypothetical protein